MALVTPEYIGWPGATDEENLLGVMANNPSTYPASMTEQILRTMPIAYITPCTQKLHSGLELFTLDPTEGWGKYKEYMNANSIEINSNSSGRLKLIYNNIASLGENYSSNFSQSSLTSTMESVASEGLQDLMFVTGENIEGNAEKLKESENKILSTLGDLGMKGIGKVEEGIAGIKSQRTQSIANAMFNMLKDPTSKIDFPMMWRSSNYSASYNLNVRLYNPQPKNDNTYESLIVASMGALLGLCLPTTGEDNDDLFKWPFICKFNVPGLLRMDAAYVSSVSIVKGGDGNDISWNQDNWYRPNLIDVQLTISPLYNVMVMSKKNDPNKDRPTLKKEIANMLGQEDDQLVAINTTQPTNEQEPTIARTLTSQQEAASDALLG